MKFLLRVDAVQFAMVRPEKTAEPAGERSADQLAAGQVVTNHYEREHLPLRRYLLFLGIGDATAQEIVQETFFRLYQDVQKHGPRPEVRAWLFRVAHNLARNDQASSRNALAAPFGEETRNSAISAEASPEMQVLANERNTWLAQAIRQLTGPQRNALLLRGQGMKYREIADVLDISIASVGENVQRGLQKLQTLKEEKKL